MKSFSIDYVFSRETKCDEKSWEAICKAISCVGQSFMQDKMDEALTMHTPLFQRLYQQVRDSLNDKNGIHGGISIQTSDPAEIDPSEITFNNINAFTYSAEIHHEKEYDIDAWREIEEKICSLTCECQKAGTANDTTLLDLSPITLDPQTQFGDLSGIHLSIQCNCEKDI
ncbi:MAG: hypothetical protein UU47_C0003G0003 [candidate division TM6 bacterium GW2011_GWE2_41_16]|nr:MAG: hypothetical protein UU47_C0003G0003 [candidate division TM6 bacterium GW2011_GWE2_41_16]